MMSCVYSPTIHWFHSVLRPKAFYFRCGSYLFRFQVTICGTLQSLWGELKTLHSPRAFRKDEDPFLHVSFNHKADWGTKQILLVLNHDIKRKHDWHRKGKATPECRLPGSRTSRPLSRRLQGFRSSLGLEWRFLHPETRSCFRGAPGARSSGVNIDLWSESALHVPLPDRSWEENVCNWRPPVAALTSCQAIGDQNKPLYPDWRSFYRYVCSLCCLIWLNDVGNLCEKFMLPEDESEVQNNSPVFNLDQLADEVPSGCCVVSRANCC